MRRCPQWVVTRGAAVSELPQGAQPSSSTARLVNSVLWNDTAPAAPEIGYSKGFVMSPVPLEVDHDDLDGGCDASPGTLLVCGMNVDADPLFTDAANDDLTPAAASPAIDQGADAALPADLADLDGGADLAEPTPLDRAGAPRIAGAAVDLGANEHPKFGPSPRKPQRSPSSQRDAVPLTGSDRSRRSATASHRTSRLGRASWKHPAAGAGSDRGP